MSYHTWHTYGYGICTDEIKTTVDKIEELLKFAPKFKNEIHEWFEDCDITEPTIEDYEEFDQDWYGGIATILQSVISEVEQIELTYAEDFNCVRYLLYSPQYPWNMQNNENNLTEDDIVNIFKKYVSILTDKSIIVDYQSVENGG